MYIEKGMCELLPNNKVRFQKVNYANVSTNNYALDEVEPVA